MKGQSGSDPSGLSCEGGSGRECVVFVVLCVDSLLGGTSRVRVGDGVRSPESQRELSLLSPAFVGKRLDPLLLSPCAVLEVYNQRKFRR